MIKIKNQNKEKISFITDMSVNLANAIRRGALEIPILAIDEIEIIKNDSALYDEMLAHRLGLVPIKTSKTSKEVKFKLKGKGPKTISSEDLTPSVETDYSLPLTLLDENQEIELVAHAKLGRGIEHIKYSPGLIYYKHDLSPEFLEFVNIDENGKITYNEKELKDKGLNEKQIADIKKLSQINELEINIESWGQIGVKDIFLGAIEVLDKNLSELGKAIK